MERVKLGRTNLMVSPAGLGCGGYSRLGMTSGGDEKSAEAVVSHALDLGVNFFDTARAYRTEEVVGRAVARCRDEVVLSTKTVFMNRDNEYMQAADLVSSLEKSLKRLQTDYVDVFSLHGVTVEHLDHCLEVFVPALAQQVKLGKIRHLGITESFRQEPVHDMLIKAIPSGAFDVVMVGFNFLNTSARQEVFQLAQNHDVGTQIMHAVRRALANPEVLRQTLTGLIENGEIEAADIQMDEPLGFLRDYADVASITEAAYRYCRHEPGVSVVLTGTGSKDHLTSNVAAINADPLPAALQNQLNEIFGRVISASGD